MLTPDRVIEFLNQSHTDESLKYTYHRKAYSNKENIKDLCEFLSKQNLNSWYKRIELSNIDIYTNDQTIFEELLRK